MKLYTLSCRKCARTWQATWLATEKHHECPFCGSTRIHVLR